MIEESKKTRNHLTLLVIPSRYRSSSILSIANLSKNKRTHQFHSICGFSSLRTHSAVTTSKLMMPLSQSKKWMRNTRIAKTITQIYIFNSAVSRANVIFFVQFSARMTWIDRRKKMYRREPVWFFLLLRCSKFKLGKERNWYMYRYYCLFPLRF